MQIEVLSVSVEDKGKYKSMEVAYKGSDGKATSKKMVSFGAQEAAYKALSNAKQGDVFQVQSEKNDKGYWDWIGIESGAGTTSVTAAKRGGNATPQSTYETAEERANKQVLIVRQSSLSNAVEYFKLNPKAFPAVQQVLDLAKEFEEHVFGKKSGPFDDFPDDIPL